MTDAEIRALSRQQKMARAWMRRLTLFNTPSRMVVWYDSLWTDLRFEEEAHCWENGFRDILGPIKRPLKARRVRQGGFSACLTQSRREDKP